MEMEFKFLSKALFFFLLLSLLSSFSSSSFISDGVFDAHPGRNLLRAEKACPVNFEFMNYTPITSICKGPKYPARECCAAFKAFACRYIDYINDLSTDCAFDMFCYINLHGKYPTGLFAHKCKEGKEGLKCKTT